MARNTLKLDTSGFEDMLLKLEHLGGDVRKAVTDALEQSAETIELDTKDAIQAANLPAQGKYSRGDTADSVIQGAQVTWDGNIAWVPIGFDFSKPGAGGYLITGTPRMRPDYALLKMYKRKKYMQQIQNDMGEVIMDYILEQMEKSK